MRKLTTEQFIQKAKAIHGDKYNYSLSKYIHSQTKVLIVCNEHGVFKQTPNVHLSNGNCFKCTRKYISKEIFVERSNKIHRNKYDYSLVNYINSGTTVTISCKNHGIFEQAPDNHLRGAGCPKCKSSRGELIIRNWLYQNNIQCVSQKRFINCKYKQSLSFDFYLPNHNICIEFDGKQHFQPIQWYGISKDRAIKNFKQTKIYDKIKNEYCSKNNIHLIRISYKQMKLIHKILSDFFPHSL